MCDDRLTANDYQTEVQDTAQSVFNEAMSQCDNDVDSAQDQTNERGLHEAVDGHDYVIYTAYHMEVIAVSDNHDYYEQNFGLNEGLDFDAIVQGKAFWAFYADVQEKLTDLFDEYEPEGDEE